MNAYQRRKERRLCVKLNELRLGRKLTPGEIKVATRWGYGNFPTMDECMNVWTRFRREPAKRRDYR